MSHSQPGGSSFASPDVRSRLALSPDRVAVVDASGALIHVNPVFAGTTGLDEGQRGGTSLLDLVHPDERVVVEAWLHGIERADGQLTCHVLGADAAFHRVTWSLSARDGAGLALLIGRDWTSLPREPDADGARDSWPQCGTAIDSSRDGRFRALSMSSPIGIFETDATGYCTYANPYAIRIWEGGDPGVMLGHAWVARVHPDDRRTLIDAWQAAVATRQEFAREYRLALPSGAVRNVCVHVVPLDDGSGIMVGTLEDVTERRRAEEALRRQALTFELIHDGVMVTDVDGHILDWNAAAERIYGYTRAEMLGRPAHTLFPPEVAGAQHDAIGVALASASGRWVGELHFRRKDGTLGVVESSVVVLHDADGVPIGGIGVNRDVTERVHAQVALRESEARYRQIVETSHEGICRVDAVGRISYANARLGDMLGFAPEELQGRTIFDLMDPEVAFGARTRFARRQLGISEVDELPLRRRDGACVWTHKSASPILDGQGAFTGAMYMLSDITDRHVARQRLVESERLFRALTEQSSEFVGVIDARGELRYVNPACARLLGYPTDEPIARPVLDFIDPADVGRIRAELEELVTRPGALLRTEYRVRRTNGEWALLNAVAHNLLEDPAVRGIVVNAHDITARRAADEELLRQKELLQKVLDHLPVMIVLFDAACTPVFANREWSRVSGWLLEEMRGRDLLPELYPGEEHRARAAAAIEGGGGEWVEFPMRTRDGRDVETLWATVQLSDGSRVTIGQDTTDRRQLEEQFRQAQKMEAVGRLAGGIAHDFNNLLSVIASYSGMLLRDLDADAPGRSDLHEIQRAVDRAASLTRQLLAFSRKQVLQPRVLDVTEAVEGTHRMLQRLIGEDITVTMRTDSPGLHVRADPGQLDQVLMNLAANARDAMPTGGTLRIEVDEVTVDGDLARRLTDGVAGAFARLRVADTGAGMDEGTRSRIFEPFFTTKQVGKGTGLGLATVYGIVKQSGGFISVDSRVGEGTAFTILLPRVDGAERYPPVREPRAAIAPAAGGTVLLVEDEPALRAVSHRLLTQSGYRVLDAGNGVEALRLVALYHGRLDLIISDVVMPHMSGQELVRHLAPRFGEVPVLFMSGYAMEAIEQHGELLPGAAFLSKPFAPPQFLDAVARAVSGTAAAGAGRRLS